MHPISFRSVRPVFALAIGATLLVAPQSFARTEIPSAAQPQLAASADGRVWLIYGQAAGGVTAVQTHDGEHKHDGSAHGSGHAQSGTASRPGADVFLARSDDGGATFGPAIKVATVPGLMLGMRRGPRIAAHGDDLTVTVVAQELIAFHSADAGRTWAGPVTINDAPRSAQEGLHDLAVAPDGKLFTTWLDIRNGKMELWGAESNDAGKTWSKNEQVYKSPDKSICECCNPNALFDADGNLAVMWRNSIEGYRDLWMTTRSKGAKPFTPAHKLGEGTWKLNACPMDGGKIVALGGGKFGGVWQRNGEVFFTPLGGTEILLGPGKQPVAVAHGTETVIVWQQGTDLVSVLKPGDTPHKFAVDSRFACVVALTGGSGAVLAYEQGPAKEKQPGIVVEPL